MDGDLDDTTDQTVMCRVPRDIVRLVVALTAAVRSNDPPWPGHDTERDVVRCV